MASGHFNVAAFYAALDGHRQAKRMNWKQAAGAAGVSASTLTRLAQGKRPDVDSLTALLSWSGLKAEMFVAKSKKKPAVEPLAHIAALLRADPNLPPEGAKALVAVIKAAYEQLRRV